VAGLFLAFLGIALGASGRYRRLFVNLMLAAVAGLLWYVVLELGASMVQTEQIPSWFGEWSRAITACLLATLAWWRYGARHAAV
jgi:lipopolysaccharide export LptBFGC system permease protein LptF